MKTMKMTINYGGFVGADEEVEFDVADDATESEIEDAAYDAFEETVLDRCSYEIIEEEDD